MKLRTDTTSSRNKKDKYAYKCLTIKEKLLSHSDRPAWKCFRCGSEDYLIAKCPKPPKDGEKKHKKVSFKEKGNSAKDNSDDDDDLKVYASMA